jgi:hypothetical protein
MRNRVLLLSAMLIHLSYRYAAAADASQHLKELHLIPSICQAPCIEYRNSTELQNDWTFAASPSSLTSNNLYPTIETDVVIAPVDRLELVGDIIFEPVEDVAPGRNQAFNNLGAYADQLFVGFATGPVNLQAGKIHPAFGRAWDVTPGLHSTDIPGNYELEERIGAGAAYGFDAYGFQSIFQTSAFTVDRTVLSESVFTDRHRARLSDGGAGNTSGLSSLAVQLDSCLGAAAVDCYADGDFGYQLAGRYQQAGRGDAGDELGFVASANKSIAFDEKTVRLFGEAAYFRNFEGSSDNALFLTASGELEIDPMSYSLAYTRQQNLPSGGSDQLIEVAAAYDLGEAMSLAGEEWSIAMGYSFRRNEGQDTHILAVLLTIDFSGSFP